MYEEAAPSEQQQPNVTGLEGMAKVAHLPREKYVVVTVGTGWDVYAPADPSFT